MSSNIKQFPKVRRQFMSESDRRLAEWVERFRKAMPRNPCAALAVIGEAKLAGRGSQLQAALSRGDAEIVPLAEKREVGR